MSDDVETQTPEKNHGTEEADGDRRSTRIRRDAVYFSPTAATPVRKVTYEVPVDGSGVPLKVFPEWKKILPTDCTPLYRILVGRPGLKQSRKRELMNFRGFLGSSSTRGITASHLTKAIESQTRKELKPILKTFRILGKTVAEQNQHLSEFLMSPVLSLDAQKKEKRTVTKKKRKTRKTNKKLKTVSRIKSAKGRSTKTPAKSGKSATAKSKKTDTSQKKKERPTKRGRSDSKKEETPQPPAKRQRQVKEKKSVVVEEVIPPNNEIQNFISTMMRTTSVEDAESLSLTAVRSRIEAHYNLAQGSLKEKANEIRSFIELAFAELEKIEHGASDSATTAVAMQEIEEASPLSETPAVERTVAEASAPPEKTPESTSEEIASSTVDNIIVAHPPSTHSTPIKSQTKAPSEQSTPIREAPLTPEQALSALATPARETATPVTTTPSHLSSPVVQITAAVTPETTSRRAQSTEALSSVSPAKSPAACSQPLATSEPTESVVENTSEVLGVPSEAGQDMQEEEVQSRSGGMADPLKEGKDAPENAAVVDIAAVKVSVPEVNEEKAIPQEVSTPVEFTHAVTEETTPNEPSDSADEVNVSKPQVETSTPTDSSPEKYLPEIYSPDEEN